jgi:hypothetical protein
VCGYVSKGQHLEGEVMFRDWLLVRVISLSGEVRDLQTRLAVLATENLNLRLENNRWCAERTVLKSQRRKHKTELELMAAELDSIKSKWLAYVQDHNLMDASTKRQIVQELNVAANILAGIEGPESQSVTETRPKTELELLRSRARGIRTHLQACLRMLQINS